VANIAYVMSMNIATRLHLRHLLHAHETLPGVAQALGVRPRAFRHQRRVVMPDAVKRAIANAARVLFLRFILQELLRSGVVSRAQLRDAAATARKRLEAPEKGNKRALQQLEAKEGAAGRSKGPAKKTRAKGSTKRPMQTRLPGT